MAIGSLNSINPFQKAYGANLFAAGSVNYVQTGSIFGQGNNNQNSSSKIDSNKSIFDTKIDLTSVSGLNPFASVNATTKAVKGVAPVHARENYRNGLAPADNLQNVYAGQINGKANILNQIAIA